jgi:hypothetical protein
MRTVNLCGQTLPHPGHVCAFFDSREQKYDVLIPFLQDAIDAGDNVVNIVDRDDMAGHLDTLVTGGVPVWETIASGQLNVQTSEDTYLREGKDVLPSLLAFLRETLANAKQHQHCVRTWGEMNWVGRGALPITDVLEYEARVNELLPDFECTMLCVYDLAHTPSSMVSDVLATHPFAIIKGRLRENPYYVQPGEYLDMLSNRQA